MSVLISFKIEGMCTQHAHRALRLLVRPVPQLIGIPKNVLSTNHLYILISKEKKKEMRGKRGEGLGRGEVKKEKEKKMGGGGGKERENKEKIKA